MSHELLRAAAASFSRGARPILAPMSLALRTGQMTIAVGPNGAGKSTMLQLFAGGRRATGGQIYFDGRRIATWRPRELARRRAVLSQSQSLAFPFTVWEVVALGLETAGGRRDGRLVSDALDRVGLPGFEGRSIHSLSGGEQQRVHLARVLCQLHSGDRSAGQFLFLDEPTASLDIQHQIKVLELVRAAISPGLGVFAILHDLNLAAAYADRLMVLSEGRIVADGRPGEVMTGPLLSGVYGIDIDVESHGARLSVLPRALARSAGRRAPASPHLELSGC